MTEKAPGALPSVAMLGSFPPQSQGTFNYCGNLVAALSEICEVHALGYAKMYPSFLFPGVKSAVDPTAKPPSGPQLLVQHKLKYYNPFGWMLSAFAAPCTVFHLQWWSLPLWPISFVFLAVMKLRRKAIVITIHNVLPHERASLFVAFTRILCRFADAYIVRGRRNCEEFSRVYGIPLDRIFDVPHAIAPAALPSEGAAYARKELGLHEDSKTILFFGIIRPYKGLETLLRAFKEVSESIPGAVLVVAGKPWTDWPPYEKLIEELGIGGRVSLFLDYVPEERVPLLFAASDIAVLPYTHFNAQSGVGARTVSRGTPLIVSDVGDLPHDVYYDRRWIVPPEDSRALAQRLIQFFDHQEAQVEEFKQVAEAVHRAASPESVARRHVEVYNRLIRG